MSKLLEHKRALQQENALMIERCLSVLPFAWANNLSVRLSGEREGRIKEVIGVNLNTQIDHLIKLGYNAQLGRTIESLNDPDAYRENCLSTALRDMSIKEVEKNLKEGREPILVDSRVDNYEFLAQQMGIEFSQLQTRFGNSILFGMMPVDRGLRYLSANKRSNVYIAWIAKKDTSISQRHLSYVDIENNMPANERGSNFLEVMSWLREHPDECAANPNPLLVLGERFYVENSQNQFLRPDNFHVPIIERTPPFHLMSSEQTDLCKKEVFLTTKYNRKELLTHQDPIYFPTKT